MRKSRSSGKALMTDNATRTGVGYANVAAPGQTGGSEYKAYTFSLRARVGF